MLLRVSADEERGNVDDLLSDSDVSLSDQNTSVVDRLGVTELEDDGLETSLHEVLNLEGEDKIELVLVLGEDTVTVKSSHQSASLEKSIQKMRSKIIHDHQNKEGEKDVNERGEHTSWGRSRP